MEAAEAPLSLHLSKCHIVGNLMHWLINLIKAQYEPAIRIPLISVEEHESGTQIPVDAGG